ncbi:Phosducin-like protein 3 [Astathelohania contejeani]|uniref:Phosducin-like protein 3 n=1 Tax=Astathelohania contejeani TaxID=164912 RepID=A0ABQ7HWM0_9MICR|nr:Phosducin-like protein 3 [Thelohania contejeani]
MKDEFEFDSDDEIVIKYKQKRLNELQSIAGKGSVRTLYDESDLIYKTKRDTMIVHFYDDRFEKCKIMDYNLEKIANGFKDIEFIRIEAARCGLVTQRLGIRVLPFLGFFKKGFFVDSVVGFEGLGTESFESEDLKKLIKSSNLYK